MGNLGRMKRLISTPDDERNLRSVITWWELRRIPYNLVVGVSGLVGLLLFLWFNALPPKLVPKPIVDPLSVILFGVGANFFYTAGWVAELIARALWPERARSLGPQLLILGSLLSIMLALFPGLAGFVFWVWRASVP